MRSLLGGIGQVLNKAPVAYTGRGERLYLPFLRGGSGPEAQMRAMGSVGTLFAIVNRTSNATSQVNWKLWRPAPSGNPEDRIEVTRHLALDIWRRPNPFMPRQEFVESIQQHIDLTGESWWIVARNPLARSIPLELWPVRPDRMEPVPDREEFIAGYIYHGPNGEQVPLKRDQVIMLRMPNPLDPYRGLGPVQSILVDLDSTRYSAEWNRNFFKNSAEPGGIIEVPNSLSDDEFDELRDRWNEQHKGVANAHKVAILEHGKWVDRKYTMKDMQFAELRGVARDTIREAFGMPKFAVGDVDDVNRATADASAAWFAEHLTVPRLERIKAALNYDFLPLFGTTAEGLEFDYESPVRPDQEAENEERTSKATAASTLVTAGWHPDDVLATTGLPAMRFQAPAPPPAPSGPPVNPSALYRARRPAAPARLVRAEVDKDETREDWELLLEELLADWAEQVTPEQIAELAEQIEAAVDDDDTEALAALVVGTVVAAGLLEAAMVAQATAGAQRMLDEAAEQGLTPPDVEVPTEDLAAAAAATAAMLGVGLAVAAGREALRVWAAGMTGAAVAALVTAYLEGLTDAELRAQLGGAIWRGENTGRWAALDALPRALVYVASEIRDRNTCGPCREVDGTEWTDKTDAKAAYPAGGYLDCDGRIRCRGTIEPVWKR